MVANISCNKISEIGPQHVAYQAALRAAAAAGRTIIVATRDDDTIASGDEVIRI